MKSADNEAYAMEPAVALVLKTMRLAPARRCASWTCCDPVQPRLFGFCFFQSFKTDGVGVAAGIVG